MRNQEHRSRSSTRESLSRAFSTMVGDYRHYSLEHRLFNIISLLNAVTNIGGVVFILANRSSAFLALLHLGTGVLFLVFYFLSRFRQLYRSLYWPFVLTIVAFLFVNSLRNSGSFGGAHYYFIPALVIAIILSARTRATILALAVFVAATVALLLLENSRPEWVVSYSNARERFFDILASFLFVQIFTGALVVVLAKSLNQERRKSDSLLLNILPESIAKELQQNERVQPLGYDDASVLFTDFVGFTQIAETLKPEELISELDGCFRIFDDIAKRNNVEKIKTIGDAYMAVGGIPVSNNTHAIDCVLAAIEIQNFMFEMRGKRIDDGKPSWELRLGIHTGKLIAGVIGHHKFAYDVWGDTVNTASRLESSGVPGRINISAATHERVQAFFTCEYRGKVPAKNKGEIDMYFVTGIRPELSEMSQGKTPNEKFLKMYVRLKEMGLNV